MIKLLLVATLLFTPVLAIADDSFGTVTVVKYCEARGNLAKHIAKSLDDGFPLDKINIQWMHHSEDIRLKTERKFWTYMLKEEVNELKKKGMSTKDVFHQVQNTCIENKAATRIGVSGLSI